MQTNKIRRAAVVAAALLASQAGMARDLTVDELVDRFNLRSIRSSYGPRLQFYCESYLREFFTVQQRTRTAAGQIELDNGDDVWTITIVGPHRIGVSNRIRSGTYDAYAEYEIDFHPATQDWQAQETWIRRPTPCVQFKAGPG